MTFEIKRFSLSLEKEKVLNYMKEIKLRSEK